MAGVGECLLGEGAQTDSRVMGSGLGLQEHVPSELAVPSEDILCPAFSPRLVSALSRGLAIPTAPHLASGRTISRVFLLLGKHHVLFIFLGGHLGVKASS